MRIRKIISNSRDKRISEDTLFESIQKFIEESKFPKKLELKNLSLKTKNNLKLIERIESTEVKINREVTKLSSKIQNLKKETNILISNLREELQKSG